VMTEVLSWMSEKSRVVLRVKNNKEPMSSRSRFHGPDLVRLDFEAQRHKGTKADHSHDKVSEIPGGSLPQDFLAP
jgi:hypothetical protein